MAVPLDAAAELGRNPEVSTRFSLSMEMSRLTRDGTAEPVSRDQILRHARGQGNIFSCSADHEQDWQPYPVDPYSAICDDHTYIHNRAIRPCHPSHSMYNVCMYVCIFIKLHITAQSGPVIRVILCHSH